MTTIVTTIIISSIIIYYINAKPGEEKENERGRILLYI